MIDIAGIRSRAANSADPNHAQDVNDLIAELKHLRDQRDAARAMADELRDDLRAADNIAANLQQHIADVRSGAF